MTVVKNREITTTMEEAQIKCKSVETGIKKKLNKGTKIPMEKKGSLKEKRFTTERNQQSNPQYDPNMYM